MTPECLPNHPFTVAMAHGAGLTRKRLDAAVRDGRVVRLVRGVYAASNLEMTMTERARAASLVISPHAVVCDRSAAWIWGVDCYAFRELDVVPALEMYTLRGHRATRQRRLRGGERDLWPDDIVIVHGVRVTSPVRTALDLGCCLNRREALAAMDALMRTQAFTTADLVRRLPRYFRRRGVVQLRELVGLVDARAESPGESWTRLEMHDHGLPRPEVNWWVVVGGVRRYRLDLAYPHAKVAIEYDGEEFHSSDGDRSADRERRAWPEDQGWTVIVVDKRCFSDEAIERWVAEIRTALTTAQTPPRRWYGRH